MRSLSLFAFIFLLLTNVMMGQGIADPTTWTYEVKKIDASEYELIFHVSLNEGWHIFSQKPGDEFLIPPSFSFTDKDMIKLIGEVEERGKLKTEKMEGIDSLVSYYEGKVDFVQKVQIKGKMKITGEHEYQVCNDAMCLPPKTKKFEFDIR